MKLIRKIIFILAILFTIEVGNLKSLNKRNLYLREESVNSDLVFLEKLNTLDNSIKNEEKEKQNNLNSGFEEFDNPVTKVVRKENSIDSIENDQNAVKDENEDKFGVENDLVSQKDSFAEEKEEKTNHLIEDENNTNFVELNSKKTASDAEFFRNKLDEINKFETFLLDQEKQLEQKSKELLDRTKRFLK